MSLTDDQRATLDRLPRKLRFMVGGTPWDIDLTAAFRPLAMVHENIDWVGERVPAAVVDLVAFGETRYAEGGGATTFLGISQKTGEIVDIDPEREGDIVCFVNSDLGRFVESLSLLRQTQDVAALRARMTALEGDRFPGSLWDLVLGALSRDETRSNDRSED
jgi:hypothetical protein